MKFKTMGIADVSHQKRIWLIRHLIEQGMTENALKKMNATDEEIEEARGTRV